MIARRGAPAARSTGVPLVYESVAPQVIDHDLRPMAPQRVICKDRWLCLRKRCCGAWRLICYLPTLAIVSYIGSAKFGGLDYLPFGWDLLVVAVIGLVYFLWGVKSGWRTPSVEAIRIEAQQHPHAVMVPPDEAEAERVTGH